jgi:hypothetical protein
VVSLQELVRALPYSPEAQYFTFVMKNANYKQVGK